MTGARPLQASPAFRSARNYALGTQGMRPCTLSWGQPWRGVTRRGEALAARLTPRLLAWPSRMSDCEARSRPGFPEGPSCSKALLGLWFESGLCLPVWRGVGGLGLHPSGSSSSRVKTAHGPLSHATRGPGRPLQLLALVSLPVKWVQKENFPGQPLDVTGSQSYKINFI